MPTSSGHETVSEIQTLQRLNTELLGSWQRAREGYANQLTGAGRVTDPDERQRLGILLNTANASIKRLSRRQVDLRRRTDAAERRGYGGPLPMRIDVGGRGDMAIVGERGPGGRDLSSAEVVNFRTRQVIPNHEAKRMGLLANASGLPRYQEGTNAAELKNIADKELALASLSGWLKARYGKVIGSPEHSTAVANFEKAAFHASALLERLGHFVPPQPVITEKDQWMTWATDLQDRLRGAIEREKAQLLQSLTITLDPTAFPPIPDDGEEDGDGGGAGGGDGAAAPTDEDLAAAMLPIKYAWLSEFDRLVGLMNRQTYGGPGWQQSNEALLALQVAMVTGLQAMGHTPTSKSLLAGDLTPSGRDERQFLLVSIREEEKAAGYPPGWGQRERQPERQPPGERKGKRTAAGRGIEPYLTKYHDDLIRDLQGQVNDEVPGARAKLAKAIDERRRYLANAPSRFAAAQAARARFGRIPAGHAFIVRGMGKGLVT